MLNEEVRKIMSSDPVTVKPSDSIADVTKVMFDLKVQQLPVVEDNKLVGMVTSFDLWKNCMNQSKANQVSDIMTTKIIKIAPIDKVGTAAELFMDRRFKTIPVVNLDGELKGVITAFDVIKHTLKREYPKSILYSEIID
ncbi:MAG TPA: CBS domain-containing protein [Saprospiraceae bacterium]|nr:CBS domain-containing protein [Saprospiraceae bacterium]MCB9328234.1 CBS domain-containing protein [Lewinellaceae bacterium]HPK09979.1 CBS domain-containing protein [Saprospiraceae bacterium]HPQ21170.1 CBS domain-containing protein [Saprospiraceae bacterium]HRX28791.1 CBS domain-containing protein [Saprospiraceae bacterium]